jgi:hypothetical protein
MCGTDNYSFTDFKNHAIVSGDFIGTKVRNNQVFTVLHVFTNICLYLSANDDITEILLKVTLNTMNLPLSANAVCT